ncbi:ATP-dependent DNA helicase [Mycena sanguinolenta]|uniref:ATP-dependent DNA helicase n=1 Tax=Mycena sanguinolenta TaxID=230812 RepID=A0A8H7CH76_9AGAR|nr:ATP-dependent DNA helicase [Mycena sanguinolenta]
MSANAIMFSQPVLSVMNKLPPSREEMSEVLAFIFIGSSAPTEQDFERTPMLVRKQKVIDALEWLKLNHEGYADLQISLENLASYKDRDIPVVVDYRRTDPTEANLNQPGTMAVFDVPEEQGTADGQCSFAVHGLTGTEYSTASMETIKMVALEHLTSKRNMLGIGRAEEPLSLYDNVEAYPGMFPWLFPYGKGGIGHPSHANKQGDLTRKRNLLMYHDKRFQMFASVYDVFEKNAEFQGGDETCRENARHMLRKMVNSMSAKMEIGSPMAAMYLLGNPDHYSSHSYVPFAWRPYVQFVRNAWTTDYPLEDVEESNAEEERIPIGEQDGKFITTSGVDDYRYRPDMFSHLNVYEWVQCSSKRKRSAHERMIFEQEMRAAQVIRLDKKRAKADEEVDSDLEDWLEDDRDYEDIFEEGECGHVGASGDEYEYEEASDWKTDDEDDVILEKQSRKDQSKRKEWFPFRVEHSLFWSHAVTCELDRLTNVIPNFIGGSIPRSDKGDRAAYCMTILTLFKPWRSPMDLKRALSTWDDTFKEHEFTERQRQLMKNFNVRYECNDARDDHYAQMKKKMAAAKDSGRVVYPSGFMGLKDEFVDDINDVDDGLDGEDVDRDLSADAPGPRSAKIISEMKEMANIMQTSGWLDPVSSSIHTPESDLVIPPSKSRGEWSNIIRQQRLDLTANKLANMPRLNAERFQKVKNEAVVVPYDYFMHRSLVDPATNSDIISSIIMDFKLNKEQTRAFKIVADHASSPQTGPLRMYLGGMGGTGKSQVLKAIIEFFSRRKEDYRYMRIEK